MTDFQPITLGRLSALRRAGQGAPLVIVPGVMADAQSWLPVAEAITALNPVVIVNRRGRSPSPDLGSDYGIPIEIDDLSSLVSSIGEPVHLFGWSYGGLIAIEAAVRGLPVRTLTAYEPVSRPFVPEAIEPVREALARGDAGRAVEIINIDVSGFDAEYVTALRETPAWETLCRLSLPLAEELSAIDRFEPSYDDYAAIESPMSLIIGELNVGHAPYGTAFDRFSQAMLNARVHRLAGQGHLAHVEDPSALARQISAVIISGENRMNRGRSPAKPGNSPS